MVLRESLDPDNSLWDWIAVDLFFYRSKHGMSCAQLGQRLKVNRQAVSNMEAGRYRLDETKAKILDDLWHLNKHFQRLLHYARTGHDPDWFKAHVRYEARATTIKIYEALVLPGLLQTPGYARALLTAGRADDVEAAVAGRLARQEILARPSPPDLWVILCENVLDWPVGGPEVMKAQLAHLLEIGELPHVAVRVLPRSAGANDGLEGSFEVLTVREGDISYMEACGGGRLEQDPAEVRRYGIRHDRIGALAESVASSRRVIAGKVGDLRMTKWRKSSHSGTTQGTDCVELTRFASAIGLRDSKAPEAGHLNLSAQTFSDLIARVKRGELSSWT
ncbi:Scr1 family TA system antitoxin-like transcriptional regulator [Spirillospora sp. NPDC048911]|uniref:Scr1 family TA system antitoxin-like transcriptional regulator n=1 Tax=Spirillospora sp. NPDC048911 TaxID=3364527 RepID=UPI0037128FA9